MLVISSGTPIHGFVVFPESFLTNPVVFFLPCVNRLGHAPSSMYDVVSAKWIRFRSQRGVKVAVPLSLCHTGAERRVGGEQDADRGGMGRESSSQCAHGGWDVHGIETFRNTRGQNDRIQEERRNSGRVSNPQSRQYEYVTGPTVV